MPCMASPRKGINCHVVLILFFFHCSETVRPILMMKVGRKDDLRKVGVAYSSARSVFLSCHQNNSGVKENVDENGLFFSPSFSAQVTFGGNLPPTSGVGVWAKNQPVTLKKETVDQPPPSPWGGRPVTKCLWPLTHTKQSKTSLMNCLGLPRYRGN